MKKVKKSLLIVFALIMVLATVFAFVGCKDNVETNEAKSIAIVIDGEKITLEEGSATVDAIKSAITVEATLNDGTKVVVTDYEIKGFDPNAEGEQTVTVTYKSLTATIKVEVSKSQEEPTPVKIEIQKAGDKLELTENNATVDAIKSAITVKVVYSDNSEKIVSDYEISGFNPGAEGEQNVSIKHSGLTATLVVIVNHSEQPVLTGITVASTGDEISLEQGYASVDALKALITVTAEYSDGSSVVVTNYEIIGLDVDAIGTQTVAVKYGETTVTVDVQIIELIVSLDYKVVINGNVVVRLNPMDCDDPHVTEQYSATFNLAKGDSIVITDVEGNEYANFEPDCKFNGEATVSGSYTLYLKFYQDGGDSIWVTAPQGDDPDPTPELVIKVIVGENEYTMVENIETDKSDGRLAEYMVTVTLNVGDSIVIVDNNNHEYVNYEPACPFKGTALATGDHDIYVKIYSDGDSIWVTAPQGDDPDPIPDPEYTVSVVINGDVENAVVLTAQESEYCSMEYTGTFTLAVGDTIQVLASDGYEYTTYENADAFDGTAKVAGEYTIYVKCYDDMSNAIYTVVPQGEDPDPTPATYKVVVGDTEIELETLASDDENVTAQYTATFNLVKGDVIKVVDNNGKEYANYETNCTFKGTALADGEHTLYFKLYQDGGDSIWVTAPENEDPDPTPDPEYTVSVVINGDVENAVVLTAQESTYCSMEYTGTFTLAVGDTIKVIASDGYEYATYENAEDFDGTAKVAGEYTIYVKCYEDLSNTIYTAVPQGEDPDPIPATYKVVVGDTEIELEVLASDDENVTAQYTATFNLVKGDVIKVVDNNGKEYANYETNCTFKGTALADGEHTLYFKLYQDGGDSIWVTAPEIEDPDPIPDPEYTISVVINGDVENAVVLTAQESEYCSMEYTGTFTLAVGDTIKVIASDGYEYTTYENADEFEGTAKVAGEYTIYVKCYEDLSNAIYTVVPQGEDPDPIPDPTPDYTLSVVINGDVENAIVLTAQESEYCSMEYTGTFTLAVGDTIKIIASDGYEYATYENADEFDGTAKVAGEYTIYVKCYDDMSNAIYTVVPQVEDPDPTPATYKVVVGDTEIELETLASDDENVTAQYTATFNLVKGDVIKVVDNNGKEYANYETNCTFKGTALADGEHTLYFKLYQDGGDSIWVTAPEVEDPDPIPDYTISVVINGDVENAVVLTAQESAYCSMEYTGTFTLAVGDTIKIIASDGYEYVTYENAEDFDGTAKVAGEYTIYVKCYEDLSNAIYTQVPSTVVDPDPDVKNITVYYYNKDNWTKVNAYAWTGNTNNAAWPGVAMTAVEGHDGWYSIEVSTALTSIIFNNGSGKQTSDLTIDVNNVYHNGYDWTDGYNLHEGKTTRTVYYYNKDNWATVNAYAWTGMASNGVWPGLTMTAVEGHDGWYSIEVSFDFANIIFNNGSAQTKDIVIDTSSDIVYYNGGWVKSM